MFGHASKRCATVSVFLTEGGWQQDQRAVGRRVVPAILENAAYLNDPFVRWRKWAAIKKAQPILTEWQRGARVHFVLGSAKLCYRSCLVFLLVSGRGLVT